MIKKAKNKWFAHQTEHKGAIVNLVCFVFAGGSPSFFAPFKGLIPEWINILPVLYPMREKRLGDKMPEGIDQFIKQFFEENKQLMNKEIAIWGHCSGALLGMEYARLLEANGKKPLGFIVSGCESPECALLRLHGENGNSDQSQLADEDILSDLRRYQMMDTDMLENATFCKYFLPIFRADLGLFKGYVPSKTPSLGCKSLVMNGLEDKSLMRDRVKEWQEYCDETVIFKDYPGEHYFVNDQKEIIINDIADFLIENSNLMLPLLPQQRKMAELEFIEKSRGCQNTGIAFLLEGSINFQRLEDVLYELEKRHNALRFSLYRNGKGDLYQYESAGHLEWIVHDMKELSEDIPAIIKKANDINNEPMDLEKRPLYEFHKYIISDSKLLVHIKASHVVTDGPSISVLYKDMGDYYSTGAFGSDHVCSWTKFILDEEEYFASEEGKNHKKYWQDLSREWKETDDFESQNNLEVNSENSQCNSFYMDLKQLTDVAKKRKLSVFNLVLFMYNVAVSRILNVDEISVGYTMTNRFTKDKRNMVGLTTHKLKHHYKKDGRAYADLLIESRKNVNQSFKYFVSGECIGEPCFTLSYLSQIVMFPNWENVEVNVYTMNGNQKYGNKDYTLMCKENGDRLDMTMCADVDIYGYSFTTKLEIEMKKVFEEIRSEISE